MSKVKVLIIESDSFGGPRVDEVLEFDTQEDATTYVKEYNDKYNPPGKTPEWYMVARLASDLGYKS